MGYRRQSGIPTGIVSDRLRVPPRQRSALHLARRAAFSPRQRRCRQTQSQAIALNFAQTRRPHARAGSTHGRTVFDPWHEAPLLAGAQAGGALPLHGLGRAALVDAGTRGTGSPATTEAEEEKQRDREECGQQWGLEGSGAQWLVPAQPDARDGRSEGGTSWGSGQSKGRFTPAIKPTESIWLRKF